MTGDSIVLIRSAEALERLDVVIQSISADSVKFEFSGQTLDAPRSKLAGVCFFNLAEASTPLARLMAVVSDSAGNRWLAAQLAAPTGNPDILLTTRGGVKIHAPRSQLSEIDYSSGSLRFLADIEPLRLEVQDKYGVSSLVAGLADMFGPRKVVDGNPRAAAFGPTLEFWGSGSAVYRVPAEYTRLAGTVSLNPPGNRYSPCLVSVLLENKTIWERRLDNAGQPVEIDLPVQGDQRLTLLIQAQTAHPVGEIVSWHALRFVK
jgi:hypothetical protein